MNLRMLLLLSCLAASLLPQSSTCRAAEAATNVDDGAAEGDEHYDLENMSDAELEEICTSRGFELVREVDEATGQPIAHTHQDYVDAASECLQIEADLEEILQTHPEILEDVQRESERMMQQNERIMEQLRKQNATTDHPEDNITTTVEKGGSDAAEPDPAQKTEGAVTESPNNTLTYDFREITKEVIAQMKADVAKVVHLILPRKRRERLQLLWREQIRPKTELILKEQVRPTLKSFVAVAKDMGRTAYDMGRRYWTAFLDRRGAGEKIEPDDNMEQGKEEQKVNT
ncbi:hypothetical protein ACHAXT_011970 [Thalassiosira profunda]